MVHPGHTRESLAWTRVPNRDQWGNVAGEEVSIQYEFT